MKASLDRFYLSLIHNMFKPVRELVKNTQLEISGNISPACAFHILHTTFQIQQYK